MRSESLHIRARALTYYLHERRKDARIADVTPFDPLFPCIRESIYHTHALEKANRKTKRGARNIRIRPAPYIGNNKRSREERTPAASRSKLQSDDGERLSGEIKIRGDAPSAEPGQDAEARHTHKKGGQRFKATNCGPRVYHVQRTPSRAAAASRDLSSAEPRQERAVRRRPGPT